MVQSGSGSTGGVSEPQFIELLRSSHYFTTALGVALLWSALVGFSVHWNFSKSNTALTELATATARANWEKDFALRAWATRHGGVYVKPDDRTPPNPYLSHLPNRDVTTTDGVSLTLMNPAYIMNQMTREYEEAYGIKGKITGQVLLNPANKADDWELAALKRFEQGDAEVVELTKIEGNAYLRFMRPLVMQEGCVKCHGHLGFKVGDIRGGVSVSIPMSTYDSQAAVDRNSIIYTHALAWILGLIGICLFTFFAYNRLADRKRLLAQLERDALYDAMTGLPNRLLFTDRLRQAMALQRRDESYQFAVCLLDIDRFKIVNESYGHNIGDELLMRVGERLNKIMRPNDTLARMGDDEFAFFFPDIRDATHVVMLADRILSNLKLPLTIQGNDVSVTGSLGVCLSAPLYREPEQMVRDADVAMYRAKGQGKGRFELYDQEMHSETLILIRLENDLRNALELNQFSLHYQPVVNIAENRIDGFEALLRWQHPELGNIPPDRFIPLAEETGTIHEIGRWVLENACARARAWSERYSPERPFTISVNFSARQVVNPVLSEIVETVLREQSLPPGLLHCEVTETVVIEHQERASETLGRLHQLGVSISIDDFGKGYSSLTYLHKFDFDILKIDRAFVQGMEEDVKGWQLVRTIMSMARDLEMKVVAEGVELPAQLSRLEELQCVWIQGYLFSRPLPVDEVEGLLQAGLHRDAMRLIKGPDKT